MSKIKITVNLLTTKKNYHEWETDAQDVLALNKIGHTIEAPSKVRNPEGNPYKHQQEFKTEEEREIFRQNTLYDQQNYDNSRIRPSATMQTPSSGRPRTMFTQSARASSVRDPPPQQHKHSQSAQGSPEFDQLFDERYAARLAAQEREGFGNTGLFGSPMTKKSDYTEKDSF